jgi:hypothetical protein
MIGFRPFGVIFQSTAAAINHNRLARQRYLRPIAHFCGGLTLPQKQYDFTHW